jgi:hypothetical protein
MVERTAEEYSIAANRYAPREARRHVLGHLPAGFPDARRRDLALAVSELVSCGIRERIVGDAGWFVLRMEGDAHRMHVEIRGNGDPTTARGWRAVEESVLELAVLNAISSSWGVLADGRGTWITMDT